VGSQVFVVVARPRDPEGFSQPSWPTGQESKITRRLKLDVTSFSHELDPANRFCRAKQYAAGLTIGKARYVEAPMISIYEINVSVPRWAKQNVVTRSTARRWVRSRIFGQVGLDLNDTRDQAVRSGSPD
jgi:hypothetical protein